jgi:hypothetical protein
MVVRGMTALSARSDRRTNVFTAHEHTVAAGDDTPHGFPGFWINAQWVVVDALFNLELTQWLSGVGSFVNIGRHIFIPGICSRHGALAHGEPVVCLVSEKSSQVAKYYAAGLNGSDSF